jgi:hypothetical protein
MRTLLAGAFLTVALLAAPAAARAEPLELFVGQESPPLGILARCDDLTVVAVTADGFGLKGLKPGSTICSFDRSGGGGIRRIFEVVVKIRPPPGGPTPSRGR